MSIASSRPPDQGRVPYLQQLAQRGDRRLLLGSVAFAAIGLVLAVHFASVPYSLFLYGADLLSEQHKIRHSAIKRRMARAIFGGATTLIAISNWTRDLALGVLGELGLDGHGQRLRVVHPGTDPMHFRPGVDPRAVRERFGLPDGGTRWLVTVARLQRHKGMDTVIQALPAILARAPDVRYAVAGAGPDRERLEKLTHKLGLADRVRFLGGVTDEDLPALYNLALL